MTTVNLLGHILEQLERVRLRCPELRFGQLIAMVGELGRDETGHSLWDVEDADFAAALERFANDMAGRETTLAELGAASDRGGTIPGLDPAVPEPPRQVN